MIRHVSIILTFYLPVLFYSSAISEEIAQSKLQIRKGLAYEINSENLYTGKVVNYYAGGQKREEYSYENGRTEGVWISRYANGSKAREGSYKKGKMEGKWIFWYESGRKKREGNYKENKMEGEWIFWDKNGTQREEHVGNKFYPPLQGAVNDYANVISMEYEMRIESLILDLFSKTSVKINICIMHHIGNNTIDSYAKKLMEKWGKGKKSILIVSVLDQRKVQIESIEEIISDNQINDILHKHLVPNFKEGNFDNGFFTAAQEMAYIVRDE